MKNGDKTDRKRTGIYLYLDAVCCYADGRYAGCSRAGLADRGQAGKGTGTVIRRRSVQAGN